MDATRRALVVRGGWPGHQPEAATDLFLPGLRADGVDVVVSDSLDVYADTEWLRGFDLVVQCWSMGDLTEPQGAGLVAAVRSGVGFAGWHGGVVGTFTGSRDYLRMVGGQFLHHPPDFLDYDVTIRPERADHPIVEGIGDFAVHTEQYWLITDGWNDVLATTTVHPGPATEFTGPVVMPVVWTRRWGAGKVFFSAIGHQPSDLVQPQVRELTERGLRWASR
jgi:type 1 glutamine amidotransferase